MFDLTKIKTKYVCFDFNQNKHYVGHVTYVPNLFDYDYNVIFHDVTILK